MAEQNPNPTANVFALADSEAKQIALEFEASTQKESDSRRREAYARRTNEQETLKNNKRLLQQSSSPRIKQVSVFNPEMFVDGLQKNQLL